MITLHYAIRTAANKFIGLKSHTIEEQEMIELMGTKEKYIDYVKERYADEMLDEYGVADVIVEFIGEE